MKLYFDPAELTKEKSLWEIFIASRKIKATKFNKTALISVAILSGIYAFILEKNATEILEKSRELSELGLTYSITILGFLIAGFTIFATLTKPQLLLRMMDKTHKESQLTYLKYNYFVFMRVFIFYLSISSIFLFVIIFCCPNGIVPHILQLLPHRGTIQPIIIKIAYVFLTCCVSFLILLLKGFIYNIYSITMNNLRWEHHELTKKK